MSDVVICETAGCQAEARLQCPQCLKLKIKGSFFCTQECFKSNWNVHKSVHKKLAAPPVYNPWPYYSFTGTFIRANRPTVLFDLFFLSSVWPAPLERGSATNLRTGASPRGVAGYLPVSVVNSVVCCQRVDQKTELQGRMFLNELHRELLP